MSRDEQPEIANNIRMFGQHLVCVHADDNSPADFEPFVYSIGNYEAGFPELLFIGSNGNWCCDILNILGRIQRERGSAFHHRELVDYTAKFPALIVQAGQKACDEYAVQAGVYYDVDRFDVCQILLADQNGKYPGDPECLPPYSEQIVLLKNH